MSPDDDGPAISYKVLARGTRVVTADGVELGTVEQVLDNVRENIFDGIVVGTAAGTRFVDAPEVARITERVVTLTIGADAAQALPPHDPKGGGGEFQANPKSRFRPWRRTSR
jgi:sporulation protein YlmC with PRC-barrel domain